MGLKNDNIIKSKIIYDLEGKILAGTEVIIFDIEQRELFDLLCRKICDFEDSKLEVWHNLENSKNYKFLNYIEQNQMDEIIQLYRLYDFSDKILVLSLSNQYASLLNYGYCNLLSWEEVIDAILFDFSTHNC